MNQLVQRMVRLIKEEQPRLPDAIAINASLYALGTMTAALRVRLNLDGDYAPLHYYGITLARSGVGKDRAVDMAMKMISIAQSGYEHKLKDAYFSVKLEDPEGDYVYPPLEYAKGTSEGFNFARKTLQEIGFGVSNFRVNELGDAISNKDFDESVSDLVQAYEKGYTPAKLIKGGKSFEVNGVPVNMLIYGSPMKIKENPRVEDKLQSMMGSGLARRSFAVYDQQDALQSEALSKDDRLKKRKKKVSNEFEMEEIQSEIGITCASKASSIGANEILVSDDAYILYDEYNDLCNSESSNIKHNEAIASEIRSRAWKTLRLAAIFAFFDRQDEVSEQNMRDAIEWAESRDEDVKELLRKRTNEERIFDYLNRHDDLISRHQIKAEAIGSISKVEFEYSMEIIHEYADKKNSVIIEKIDGNKTYYRVEPMAVVDSEKITISVSKDMAKDFERKEGKWDTFSEVLQGNFNYSAGLFRDNHRNKENYLGEQDVVILDVDDGLSLSSAKQFFSQWDCWISTTKSHQVDKGGITCDRYRVVLLANVKIALDADTYGSFMANVMEYFGGFADPSCKDASRFYYGNPKAEVWRSPSRERFDIKTCIPETKRQREVFADNGRVSNESALMKHFIRESKTGARNNNLFRFAAMMKDAGEDWESKVIELNSKLDDPLSEKELSQTVIASIGRKA